MVVAGLGNPGKSYEKTRHNAGFMFLDRLARQWSPGGRALWREKWNSQLCVLEIQELRFLLAKPITYMNRSGEALARILSFYKIPLERVTVVCDDVYLPLGRLRLRAGGGHGGHNGLRNLMTHLGETAFWRMRIGVGARDSQQGPPGQPGQQDLAAYVLAHFEKNERDVLDKRLAALSSFWPELFQNAEKKTVEAIQPGRFGLFLQSLDHE